MCLIRLSWCYFVSEKYEIFFYSIISKFSETGICAWVDGICRCSIKVLQNTLMLRRIRWWKKKMMWKQSCINISIKNSVVSSRNLLTKYLRLADNPKTIEQLQKYALGNWSATIRAYHNKLLFGCSEEGHMSHLFFSHISSRPIDGARQEQKQNAWANFDAMRRIMVKAR